MKEWIPVSTPPSKPGRYAALYKNHIPHSFLWDGNQADFEANGVTHWCEFPPPPDPFEAWWANLKKCPNKDFAMIAEWTHIHKEAALEIWQAAIASKEAK